jgi:two-component system, LytTR family, sensor kinase
LHLRENKVNKLKSIILKIIGNRVFQHILFWCLSFLVLLNILKVSAEIQKIDLIYTGIFHLPVFLIVYLNLQLLFPFFLEKGKYFLYFIFISATIAAGAGFYTVLFNNLIDLVLPGYYFIAYYSFWDISLYYLVYIFSTSLLHLARGWFKLQEIEKAKIQSELKALHSQINPHFLFNSLNSIYSLSRKNSPLVPEKIVQLSDLLRHIIYESNNDLIPLEKEIEMIGNYIELQNLRTSDKEKIHLNVSGEIQDKKIAPLLLLPFVENSFKHGLKSGAENAFATIDIEISGTVLHFNIKNTKGNKSTINETHYKGIGIENVRKRLDLIYPDEYIFKITETDSAFEVDLKINLDHNAVKLLNS